MDDKQRRDVELNVLQVEIDRLKELVDDYGRMAISNWTRINDVRIELYELEPDETRNAVDCLGEIQKTLGPPTHPPTFIWEPESK